MADVMRAVPRRVTVLVGAVDGRRQAWAVLLAAAGLPALTAILVAFHNPSQLADELLLYLVLVLAVTIVGGFWPALLAALTAGLLINWYFTPPLHTLTIDEPQNLLALLLFVALAVIVSSVVHLAARRAREAEISAAEAASLLGLARTVLGGSDRPATVLTHLTERFGAHGQLLEQAGSDWVNVAGTPLAGTATMQLEIRPDLRLMVWGGALLPVGLLEAYAAQAAAALDRERLRGQAAQAEALAEGNRMRTALLAAVSHDLRTPLASVKAGVSSLRQTDVQLSPADRAELLATVEEAADRLDGLIGNLLDMSRLQTGALRPFLRPASVEEVALLALRGLDGTERVVVALPEDLPLVATDPGLLERALANLVSNALHHSPNSAPPTIEALAGPDGVVVRVVDHGPGVAPASYERMFEPFQRLGDQSRGTGVGLGLAVARGFIEATGGRLDAAPTPGGGLTMTLTMRAANTLAKLPGAR